jgi:tryptophan synthase alpha chain
VSRIAASFSAARKDGRAAFVPYITAGDPSLVRTVELVHALQRSGADVLELGVPFSDPIADGPTNQRAAERALAAGASLAKILGTVHEIRSQEEIPIILFSYSNPVVRYGIDQFAKDAAAAGVDGLLLTDVPVEEMSRFATPLKRAKIDPVMLVTPTSTKERIKAAAKIGRGFLYFVSRTGVTGTRPELASELAEQVRKVRKLSRLPVAVGFGISTPAQVKQVASFADGVVVGSAIVDRIEQVGNSDQLSDTVQSLVTPLAAACRR